jgi:hypothetical protein
MSDLLATDDDDEIDEALTASIFEIFYRHGLVLPSYIAITTDCRIVLRPIHEGHGRSLYGNAH